MVRRLLFFDPCGLYGRLYVVMVRYNRPITVTDGHFVPICDTIKSTVAATGIEKMLKANRIPERKTVPWTPHVTSVNSPFKERIQQILTSQLSIKMLKTLC